MRVVAFAALLFVAVLPLTAAERPCHPSLSNMYHCPETSTPKQTVEPTARPCRPSLSNLWTCPSDGKTARRTKPSVTKVERERPVSRTVPSTGVSGANQYTTEARARAHCPGDTVVWANTRSDIYHFRGSSFYGNTVSGAYMCEQDALSEGIRAAKNETHP
jgi:hypothetical protein